MIRHFGKRLLQLFVEEHVKKPHSIEVAVALPGGVFGDLTKFSRPLFNSNFLVPLQFLIELVSLVYFEHHRVESAVEHFIILIFRTGFPTCEIRCELCFSLVM